MVVGLEGNEEPGDVLVDVLEDDSGLVWEIFVVSYPAGGRLIDFENYRLVGNRLFSSKGSHTNAKIVFVEFR